jgi:hypothetical protein
MKLRFLKHESALKDSTHIDAIVAGLDAKKPVTDSGFSVTASQ